MAQGTSFWDGLLALTSDKRFLIPTSMLPLSTVWLLVVSARNSNSEPTVARRAALATLRFGLLWALALTGLFLLWLAGTRILLANDFELGRALVASGAVASTFFCVAAVSVLLGC